jgi:cell fate (sporulation/competence/biofilm development) regulator YlbF (YheA/YmcA/DUF963 family)
MTSKIDEKLISNIIDEINRLKNELKDLEEYKDEMSPTEYASSKENAHGQIEKNEKILGKMKSGDITTSSALEDTNKVYL